MGYENSSFIVHWKRMKGLIISTVFLLATFSARFVAGIPANNGRIINGSPAQVGEFPYVVSITNINTDQHLCSGFIYNELWIVTAASCVSGLQAKDLRVTVGTLNLNRPDPDEESFEVKEVVVRDDYDVFTGKNNLALLEVSRTITFSFAVYFIRYDEVNELDGSPTAVLTGWGATEVGGLESLRLLKTDVSLTDANCDAYGSGYEYNYMICAGSASDQGKPCTYDEGSPLVQDGIAVGILGLQRDCGTAPFTSSIYTRLTAYFDWIQDYAGFQPRPSTTIPTTTMEITMMETTSSTYRDSLPTQRATTTTAIPFRKL